MQNIIPQDDTPQKRCTGPCGRFLLATSENFHANGKGLQPKCKQCRSDYNKANAEHMHVYNQQYYQANKETIKQDVRQYKQAHAERYAQYDRHYIQSHREGHRRACKKYDKSHPEQVRMHNARHRARVKGIPGRHTAKDIQNQYQRQKGRCYYCHKKLGTGRRAFHVDHIIPITRGGTNNPDNLVIACQPCNSSKRDRLPHEWPEGGRLL